MSFDVADELEMADEQAGAARDALRRLLEGYKRAVVAGHLAVPGLLSSALTAEGVLASEYCRCYCDDLGRDPQFCGCPCHLDDSEE